MSPIRLLTVAFTFAVAMLILASGLESPEVAHARNNYYNTWDPTYPASITDDNVINGTTKNCSLCHSDSGGGNPWNAYGWDVRVEEQAGATLAEALVLVEGLDSDGDGVSNIDEINAGTQPAWTNGNNNIFFFKNLSTTLNNPPEPGILGDLDAAVGVPGAPTGVTATAGDTQASLTWTAPASDGGSAILDYTVTTSPADVVPFTTADATPSATITGLTNGTAYIFTVTARNANGSGSSSTASNSVTPSGLPGAPTAAAATAGDTQADVTWTAPADDGGSTILDYTVTSNPGGLTATSATSPATVSGLTNGTAYSFTVTARNANGSSSASAASNSVTPSGLPGVPTAAAATAGDTQADVTWTAPADDGGSAILDYTVTSSPGGLTATSATSPATVSGLTNGTAYTFTVTARNANGSGSASAASNSVTPSGLPGAPTAAAATAGDTQADVTWTAPVDDGGSAILDYTVTSSPGALTATSATSPATVSGLTNGTAYTFTVTARNANGSGSASTASNSVTPSGLPGAPTAAAATAGDTQADVTWTAPADDGGTATLDYTVTSNPGGLTATSSTSPATVSGLTNGTAYSFTVTARNANGSGSSSTASNSVTPTGLPGAPTAASASPGDTQATVSWTAPADDGGSTILDYTVTTSPGDVVPFTTADATPSATITGLNNGTSYTFTITARNVNGSGSSSTASNLIIPIGLPGAPTAAAATAGDTQADVTWTAPADDGGTTILDYTVTTTPADVAPFDTAGPVTNATVAGLTNGTLYTFTVSARNAAGNGPDSIASNSVTPSTVPGAPTAAAATAGDAQADVTWIAPASDGGSAILDYTVTSSPGGLTSTSATSPATVSGLTNGTAYTFTVTARNANGSGPSSTASNSVTPTGLSAAPTGASASAGDTQADVTWTAPADDGGTAILDYTVTTSPADVVPFTTTGAVTNATITGLTNGTVYTFTVTARNANGSGPDSTASNSVTPTATPVAPDAPTGVTATAGDTEASLTWTAPASDGGSAILDYTVTTSPADAVPFTTADATPSATITGLTNGTSYTFTVTARNAIGIGTSSTASNSVTPSGLPGAPTGASATAGDAEASVTWTAPASDGGSALLDYTVTTSPADVVPFTTTGAVTNATITGLTNGTAYTFTVTARNTNGSGSASTASNSVTPSGLPGSPTGASATAGDTQADVTWTAPADDGGSAILDYTVTTTPADVVPFTTTGAVTNATITGLTNGTPYTFTVTARNTNGSGPSSGASNSVTPTATPTAPDAPTGATATAGDTQASLTWTAPASDGGSAILDYTVTTNPAHVGPFTTADATPSATITGLTNGTAYTFTVTARNVIGTGPSSTASNSVTPSGVPGTPTAASATAGDTQADVTWTAPADDGGSAILDYTVTTTPADVVPFTTTGAVTNATITGLTNGTAYTFTVTARNANGSGPDSTTSNSVTPSGVPGAPTGASASAGDTQASLTWVAPASDGSSPILDYTVTSNPGGLTATTPDGTTLNATVTGLTNGTSYSFTVTARNTNGSGSASTASNSVTPSGLPGSPTGASASAGDTQASLTWIAPVSDGGSAVLDYTVTTNPAHVGPFTTADATPSATISGLTNGQAYTFTVTARNANGSSPSSPASNSVTPTATPTAPDVPTAVVASAGDAQASLTWTAPASDGGSPVLDYTVTTSPADVVPFTTADATPSTTIAGLTNGQAYTFTVTARNSIGSGPDSAPSNSVTPTTTTAPDAPTGASATAGNTQASVTWTPPAGDGGSPILDYTVTTNPAHVGPFTTTDATPSATITGLTNGQAYTFTVTARNAVGSGPASAASNSVTPTGSATIPGAPTGVAAVAGDTLIQVTWTAPASDGGSPISIYTVYPNPADVAPVTTGSTTATVTGLTNGQAYTFTVTATNGIGEGPASTASNSATPQPISGAIGGGPHGGYDASGGVDGGLPDQCAGCHRAHTAVSQGQLLISSSPYALCLTCHNGTGSKLDVVDGVKIAAQYDPTVVSYDDDGTLRASVAPAASVWMAASDTAVYTISLRNGAGTSATVNLSLSETGSASFTTPSVLGFASVLVPAAVGGVFGSATVDLTVTAAGAAAGDQLLTTVTGTDGSNTVAITAQSKVGSPDTDTTLNGGGFSFMNGAAVTSRHDADPADNSLNPWGYNTANTGQNSDTLTSALQCSSCHNPHGNSNYRLLKETINSQPVVVRAYFSSSFVATEGNRGLEPGAPADKYTADYYGSQGGGGAPTGGGGSISSLCGACHTAYPSTSASVGSTGGGVTHYRHTTEMPYTWWTNPQTGTTTDNPETQPGGGFDFTGFPALRLASNDVDTDSIVTCLTCHRAHGSSATMAGWAVDDSLGGLNPYEVSAAQTATSTSTLLFTDNRGMCQSCHQWGQ